ncbi:MAG: hypothetical protein ACREUD_07545 [Gammaproteobacteria bacterium]
MNVVMVGYVGLVSGACLAEFGANVTCIGVDEDKISRFAAGRDPRNVYEPERMKAIGFNYVCVGRSAKSISPASEAVS